MSQSMYAYVCIGIYKQCKKPSGSHPLPTMEDVYKQCLQRVPSTMELLQTPCFNTEPLRNSNFKALSEKVLVCVVSAKGILLRPKTTPVKLCTIIQCNCSLEKDLWLRKQNLRSRDIRHSQLKTLGLWVIFPNMTVSY